MAESCKLLFSKQLSAFSDQLGERVFEQTILPFSAAGFTL
jgi:hypothetical protein